VKYVKYGFEGRYPALTAAPIAAERLCYWNVTGSTLTLTTKDDSGKPLTVGRWRRQFVIDPGRGYPYASRPGEPVGLLFNGTNESMSAAGHFSKRFRSMASPISR
jgi:hypothetical protein